MPRSAIVVGAGMGGLSAAIHARLRGWDVLIIEQSDRCGGKAAGIEIEGFHLDPGPSIIILPDIYRDVFRRAGRDPDAYLRFSRLDVLSRVYFDGQPPLNLLGNLEACLALLREIAPQDVPAFRRLFEKLDRSVSSLEAAVFERPILRAADLARPGLLKFGLRFQPLRDYRSLIDSWFSSPLLRAFFYGFPSYSGLSYNDPAPGALLIPYYMLRDGVFFPEGGVRAIPRAFERLARELGVEFRMQTSFRRFVDETTIETADGEILEADVVVCNLDKLTAAGESALEPSLSYFTLHYGIKQPIEGLEHHTLLIPKTFAEGFEALYAGRFPDPPIIYLNATQALDPEAAPPGHTNLFAVATVPSRGPDLDWAGSRAAYRGKLRGVMAQFGFDWKPGDEAFERVQDPDYFEATHGNYRGSLYGPIPKQRAFGLFPLKNWDPAHPLRAYCGGAVQPGAGLPMVTLSGKFAVDALARVR